MTTGDDELLPTRVYNALLTNGFSTVGDVVAKTELEVQLLHFLGSTTVTKIKTKLSALGLTLRPGPPLPKNETTRQSPPADTAR